MSEWWDVGMATLPRCPKCIICLWARGQLLVMTGDEAMVKKCVENVAQKDENILSLGDVARQ